jgi:hypothetical protein
VIRLAWCAGTSVHDLLRRMPANRLLRAVSDRSWGPCAFLLVVGVGYLYAASVCVVLIERGAPGWLNLVVALCIWNGLKFCWLGLIGTSSMVATNIGRWFVSLVQWRRTDSWGGSSDAPDRLRDVNRGGSCELRGSGRPGRPAARTERR